MARKLPQWLTPLAAIAVFCAAGLALIPYPGLQNDELFFAGPLYSDNLTFYSIAAGAKKIPLMVISYTGALKTWIYAGIFEVFAPTEWSVRVPMLLAGMATIWLTWLWVRRLAGVRAANVTTLLLATDSIFLITNTFDWGPVALQHILLMAGLWAVQRWVASGSAWMLASGFFCWGLGAWDKALMSWPLIGLAVAAFLVYPGEVWKRLRIRPLGIALASFLVGALPLVWFNIARAGETAAANARFSTQRLGDKVEVLRETVDGSALFGYMVYTLPPPDGKAQGRTAGRVAGAIATLAGRGHRNWMPAAYLLGAICFVLLFRSRRWRLMAFLAFVCAVGWAQMAFNLGTGTAAHHVVLLWPFPFVFLGIAFTEAAERLGRAGPVLLVALTALVAGKNLLTTNEYLREFDAYGASGGWTDAIYRLADSVEKDDGVSWYGLVDWGCLNALEVLHEGDLPLFIPAISGAGAALTAAEQAETRHDIEAPDRIFIQHTEDKQLLQGVNDRFRRVGQELGYTEQVTRTIRDRNGRPVFELFRFVRTTP